MSAESVRKQAERYGLVIWPTRCVNSWDERLHDVAMLCWDTVTDTEVYEIVKEGVTLEEAEQFISDFEPDSAIMALVGQLGQEVDAS